MSTAYVVVTVFAALWVGFSAFSLLRGASWVTDALTEYGVPRSWWPWLGTAKAAGALGLLPDALLGQRGRRRRAGRLAARQPRRRGGCRGSARVADDGRGSGLPEHAAVPRRRREEPLDAVAAERLPDHDADPEREAVLADSVGLALLVVLETLSPAERLAFVLHDMFDLPYEEIGPIVERSPAAARQLASRARRRVHGADRPGGAPGVPPRGAEAPEGDLLRRRRLVDAYLGAAREGDFEALIRPLDPDVVLHADARAVPVGRPVVLRGAEVVARSAAASTLRAQDAEVAEVDDSVGIVLVTEGRLSVVLTFTFDGERITAVDVVADPARLARLRVVTPPSR